jgi:IS6 family transposase
MAAGRICTRPSTAGAAVHCRFYLSSRRNSKAAYRFLGKILNNVKKWQIPRFINTDKAPAYGRALALLKREGRCPSDVEHRQIKYRNNVIECDHGKLKRIINATLGFKSMKTAYATIKGIEVMRALRKGSASAFYYGDPRRNAPGKQSFLKCKAFE